MEINNRLFPYPVLCAESDDYNPSVDFVVKSGSTENIHELLLCYDFETGSEALRELVQSGRAAYVLHIECSATSFRKALRQDSPHFEYRLPKSAVTGEVTQVAMILARQTVEGFASKDLNPDYDGEDICFKKGDILAYCNLPKLEIQKQMEDPTENESFFSIVKRVSADPDEIRPLDINLNDSKIQIIVDEKTYDAYIQWKQNQAIAVAMLVLPALTYTIEELKNNFDGYEGRDWFRKLQQFYSAQGQDFIRDVIDRDENPMIIAQEMLQNPVSRAYRQLYEMEVQE